MELILFIVLWMVFTIFIVCAAEERGRSGIAWFFCAFLLSPLAAGLLLALFPIKATVGNHS